MVLQLNCTNSCTSKIFKANNVIPCMDRERYELSIFIHAVFSKLKDLFSLNVKKYALILMAI